MGNVLNYYKQAELSLAAYATLGVGTPSTVELARDSVGMSTAQAAKFAETYTVVTSCHDANSSFDATVFKDASGNLTLAISALKGSTIEIIANDRCVWKPHGA